MNLKLSNNYITTAMVLVASLTFGSCSMRTEQNRMYNAGQNTQLEKRLNFDLIGIPSSSEVKDITEVLEKTYKRYPKAKNKLNLLVHVNDTYNESEGAYAQNNICIDPKKFELISKGKMSKDSSSMYLKNATLYELSSFNCKTDSFDLIKIKSGEHGDPTFIVKTDFKFRMAHELGHLLTKEKKGKNEFYLNSDFSTPGKYDLINSLAPDVLSSKLSVPGYISKYALLGGRINNSSSLDKIEDKLLKFADKYDQDTLTKEDKKDIKELFRLKILIETQEDIAENYAAILLEIKTHTDKEIKRKQKVLEDYLIKEYVN